MGLPLQPAVRPGATLFDLVGLPTPDFLASDTVFASLVNIVTWQWSGYYMIIIYAALRSIDPSIYEAARIDGANGWQTAMRIKVPMISSSMVMVITFALIGTLQFFTEPVVLRNIAQGAIDAAYTPNMYAYSLAFSYSQFNYASAIAFSLGMLVFVGLVRLPLPHAQAERTQVMSVFAPRADLRDEPADHGDRTPIARGPQRDGPPEPQRRAAHRLARLPRDPGDLLRLPDLVARRRRHEGHVGPVRLERRSGSTTTSPSSRTSRASSRTRAASTGAGSRNSFVYAFAGGIGATVLAILAGYGFAKYRFRGRGAVFTIILGSVMVPLTALVIPTFMLLSQYGIINTPWAVILPACSARSASTSCGSTRRTPCPTRCSRRPASTARGSCAPSSRSRSRCCGPRS